jgi:hypothetical protein
LCNIAQGARAAASLHRFFTNTLPGGSLAPRIKVAMLRRAGNPLTPRHLRLGRDLGDDFTQLFN